MAVLLASVVGLSACSKIVAPIVRVHGFSRDEPLISTLEVGLHTQREVERLLGTPSTTTGFDGDTWYYITSTVSTYAWLEPEVIDRKILAVKFHPETTEIAQIDNYGYEDGRIINFSKRETPTKGRELTFLQQLFGNVGRITSEQFESQTQGGGRR